MTLSTIFLSAWVVSAVVMLLLWIVQYKTENAGTVDVAWSFITPLVGVWLILADELENSVRQWLIIALALIWGCRLGSFLYKRVMNEVEDGRYRYLREYCGNHAQLVMFIFFQIQASWTLLFALPFWAASRNLSSEFGILDFCGLLVWIVAIIGEVISDRQLHDFRMNNENKGKVCNIGFWHYSRHPNYFFEWLQWWAFVLIGYGSDYWWLTWTGLIVMYVFITRITGVPYTEQQSIRSRGDAYRQYQKTTSMFFPLPPKSEN
jgi:steroid 5-alpha reductase family enzyme